MNDNLPANVQLDSNQNGNVSFATEVIATIAGLATNEVEGVASMYGGSAGIADILSRKSQNSKNLTKGVKVELSSGKLTIAVSIVIDYGAPVPEVARNIQENIKKAVETMSGLIVSAVNVHVLGLSFEKEQKAAAEIEQQQRLLLQKHNDQAIGGEMAPEADFNAVPMGNDDVIFESESAEAELTPDPETTKEENKPVASKRTRKPKSKPAP